MLLVQIVPSSLPILGSSHLSQMSYLFFKSTTDNWISMDSESRKGGPGNGTSTDTGTPVYYPINKLAFGKYWYSITHPIRYYNLYVLIIFNYNELCTCIPIYTRKKVMN